MKKIIKSILPALLLVLAFSPFVMRAENQEIADNDAPMDAVTIVEPGNDVIATLSVVEPIDIFEPETMSLGEFVLTAYCPCVKCCEIWSAEHPSRVGTGYVQKTSSGTIPTAGRTIAADTRVIPFGTTVIINGHEYIVEDRGGAIKKSKIDIFFNSHDEALTFGKQKAEVFMKTNNVKGVTS